MFFYLKPREGGRGGDVKKGAEKRHMEEGKEQEKTDEAGRRAVDGWVSDVKLGWRQTIVVMTS